MSSFRSFRSAAKDASNVIINAPRYRPVSPSYYSCYANYYDILYHLEKIHKTITYFPKANPNDEKKYVPKFAKFETFKKLINQPEIKESMYERAINLLKDISAVDELFQTVETKKLVKIFESVNSDNLPTVETDTGSSKNQIDSNCFTGGRKSCIAHVQLIPQGHGDVYLNGVRAAERFPRMRDYLYMIWPLVVTNRLEKYNVWALTKNGGTSGQSGAVRLAIAKALSKLEPELTEQLTEHNLLERDARRVERKKPGQPKARKKHVWMKR